MRKDAANHFAFSSSRRLWARIGLETPLSLSFSRETKTNLVELYLKASFGYKQVGDRRDLFYFFVRESPIDPLSLSRYSIAHGPNSKPSWPGSVRSTSSEAPACSTLTVSTTADRLRYGLACSSPASLCASPVSQLVSPPPFCPRLTFPRPSAACLAEICSSIPLSGSIYVWAAEAGGKRYGRFFGFVV